MPAFVSPHLPALAWAVAIWLLLAMPGSAGGLAPPWLTALWFPGLDKLVHAGLFAVLALLGSRSLGALPGVRRHLLATFVLTSIYGIVTETAQEAWTDRNAEIGDAVADAAGAGIACLILWRRNGAGEPGGPPR